MSPDALNQIKINGNWVTKVNLVMPTSTPVEAPPTVGGVLQNQVVLADADGTPVDLLALIASAGGGGNGTGEVDTVNGVEPDDDGNVDLTGAVPINNLSGLGAGIAEFLATPSGTNLAAAVTNETGSGALVFGTSPTLVTPLLGTPASGVLTNCTGLPVLTGISGMGTGIATFLATPSGTNLAAAVTGETGTGALVFATSPTLVTPLLGTPASGVLTNCTGLPVLTGISGMGTGIATFLTTPTSANLAAAVTNETGSGALVFGTSPTLTTPTVSGIATSDGANVTTVSAMGALSINTAKGLNTKSISGDSTFTFSGAPATADTWFAVHVTNTDAAVHILTFPSSFSLVAQAARTSCPIPASGQLLLAWRYDGTNYHLFGDGPFLNNFSATTDPGVGDDVADGYGAGSQWGNTSSGSLFWCASAGLGAAVWHELAAV